MMDTIKKIVAPMVMLYALTGCGNKTADISKEPEFAKGMIEVEANSSKYGCAFDLISSPAPHEKLNYSYAKNLPLEGKYCNVLTMWTGFYSGENGAVRKGITFIDKGADGIWNEVIRGESALDAETESLDLYMDKQYYEGSVWNNLKTENLDTMKNFYQSNIGETLQAYTSQIDM